MGTFIILLRGINVGGNNLVSMAELKAFLAICGMADGKTLLQSGNAVARGESRSNGDLEQKLAQEAERRLKIRTDFFVRTLEEWTEIIGQNPFPDHAQNGSKPPSRPFV